jgi:hypothetical protein
MEDIFEFKVSKQDLARIPADERAFLFFLGQAINEISCLSKITYMSGNAPEGHKLIENVHVGQTLILLRILIGKVHEAWTLFRQSPIRKVYRDRLSQEQKNIEQALGKRLGRDTVICGVRKIAFHFHNNVDEINNAFNALSDDEPWLFYLSDKVGNSFHYASELVMQRIMIETIEDASPTQGATARDEWRRADALFQTATSISRDLVAVLMSYLIQIIKEHFGDTRAAPIARIEAPELKKLSIPFFVS